MVDRSRFGEPGSFEHPVVHERIVAGTPPSVYEAWTHSPTLTAWIGSQATVDPEVGGRFEILFDTDQSPGLQGSEGCQILALLPPRMVSFTWNSPPSLPDIRGSLTFVVVEIEPAEGGAFVRLTHAGHGVGDLWDDNRAYFQRAWGLVLDRLEAYFDKKSASASRAST